MHEMFPTWIRSLVSTDVDHPQVQTWHDACEAFVAEASATDLVSLVRLAWGGADADFDQLWRRHLSQSDPLFPLKGSDNKARTLAAAAVLLASHLEATRNLALIARRCASVAGGSPATEDLLVSATELSANARDVRQIPGWPKRRDLTVGGAQAAVAVDKAVQEGAGVTADLLKAVINHVSQAAGDAIARSEVRMKEATDARLKPLLEQSDILIWLLSSNCETLDQPWADLPQLTAALVAAHEVSDRSRFDLGRPDSRTLIEFKVQSASKRAKAEDFEDLAAKLPSPGDMRELTPIAADLNAHVHFEDAPTSLGHRLHDELNLIRIS